MKKVLITGGSRGIGRSITEKFCQNGDKVVFFYCKREEEAKECEKATGAVGIKADVSNPDEVRNGVAKAREILGGIDVLVNNAGISLVGLFTDVTDGEWSKIVHTNLSGAFYVCREASKDMISAHRGRIVNIGSVWGKYGASCEVAYSATKAGIRGLTTALSKELGPSGITVNCVEPGVIDTEMNACFDEETKRSLADASALCRIGTPKEVAEAVFFLCSDGAGFITGQCLGVDGGFPLG